MNSRQLCIGSIAVNRQQTVPYWKAEYHNGSVRMKLLMQRPIFSSTVLTYRLQIHKFQHDIRQKAADYCRYSNKEMTIDESTDDFDIVKACLIVPATADIAAVGSN